MLLPFLMAKPSPYLKAYPLPNYRGFACLADEGEPSFSGTTHYASAQVLQALLRTTAEAGAPPPKVSPKFPSTELSANCLHPTKIQ